MGGEVELFISYIFVSGKTSNQQMIKGVTDYFLILLSRMVIKLFFS